MHNSFKKYLENKILRLMDQDKRDPTLSFQSILLGLSTCYRALVKARTILYKNHTIAQKELSCPVISIGNIMAGGTGKTPVAISIAGILKDMEKQSVIISRGYKAKHSSSPILAGNGNKLFANAKTVGDEPCMMAKDFSLPVVVGKNRYEAGKLALSTLLPDAIVLDDGFQHLSLKRDLDILLLDHDRPFGNKRIIPAGLLREPVETALKRCHAIVRTRCPKNPKPFMLPKNQSKFLKNIPIFNTRHCPVLLHWQDHDKNLHPLDSKNLSGQRAVIFSGIARNSEFKKTIEQLGCIVTSHLEFEDHHRYNLEDIAKINKQIEKDKTSFAITTQKDMIKIDYNTQWAGKLAVIGIEIKWENESEIRQFIASIFQNQKKTKGQLKI